MQTTNDKHRIETLVLIAILEIIQQFAKKGEILIELLGLQSKTI